MSEPAWRTASGSPRAAAFAGGRGGGFREGGRGGGAARGERPPPVRSPASSGASSASPLPSTPMVPAEDNAAMLEQFKAVVAEFKADPSVRQLR